MYTPGGSPAGTYETPVTSTETAPAASVTDETLEAELEAAGVSEETHKLSYSFSVWDSAPGVKSYARRVSAVPLSPNLEVEAEQVDAFGILEMVRADTPTPPALVTDPSIKPSTFVVSLNDWQYGKKTLQGGVKETTEIIINSIRAAKTRIIDLNVMGHNFDELIIIFGGDIIEGCANTPQGAWGLELGQRQQIEGAVALGLTAIDELAPMFDKVQVLAVRGNHGENRINNGRGTTPEDNSDTLIASLIRTATQRDPELQHVEYIIANDEAGVYTLTSRGWSLGTTHGDVYGKGVSGPTTERKVNAWYKNMAAGRDPMGMVDVLITHHYHHTQSMDYGVWEWHQTPAQDGALSEYFRQASGNSAQPGVLTFVMGEQRFMEAKIV